VRGVRPAWWADPVRQTGPSERAGIGLVVGGGPGQASAFKHVTAMTEWKKRKRERKKGRGWQNAEEKRKMERGRI